MSDDAPKRSRKSKKPNFSTPFDLSSLANVPPHNLEAEQGVIGALLLSPLLCDDIIPLVKDEDFYSDANRRIYKHLMEMHGSGGAIDLLLLLNRLRSSEELDVVGGQEYIAMLMQSVPVSFHAEYYARIIREKAALRRLIHTGSEIIQSAFAPDTSAKDLLNKAAEDMSQLCESQTTNQIADMKTVMFEASRYIDIKAQGLTDGVSTGFTDLDNLLDGLHPNELIILAARPSMGKTAFAINIAESVTVESGDPVLLVSLEMSRLELALRLICSRGRIDSNKIRKNIMSKEDSRRFMEVANEYSQAPLFIDDTPSRTISEIAAVARRLKRSDGLKLLIIDYLGLIEPENSSDPRQEQVAKIARRLKGLARELHIPILCLAQLNRQAEASKDNRPRLSHLRESGAIEQDADVVMFVHREDRYMDRETALAKNLLGVAEIIVAKQRNGPIDDVKLDWKGQFTRFSNFSDREDESGDYDDLSPYSEFSQEEYSQTPEEF